MENSVAKRIAFILDHNLMHYRVPLFQFLMSRGYDVTVIHAGKEIMGTSFKQIIVSEKKIGPFYFKSLPRLRQFDVIVQMQNIRYINTWFLVFNFTRSYKLIDWTIGTSTSKGLNKSISFLDKCRNFLSNYSSAIILYTDFAINKYSITNQQKIFIANNTVYNPCPENLSGSFKDGFLFIGSLNKRKGIDVLLKAFKSYLTQTVNARIKYLYIIGKGEVVKDINDYIDSNFLRNNVILLGEINDFEMKKKYFAKSIINISPNQAGLSVLESFSFGLPYMTRENAISGGEHLNVVNDYNGFTFTEDEEIIRLMIKCNNEPGVMKQLGDNAFDYYSKERSFDSMVETFDNALLYALGKN
ncbi:glycosyltransferase [Sphingobacterium sp. WOUb80]|uniref:glycosyltransferase n=1 Tax=Sphingobacterium sp. WOUb80 TaxID=3234028 RepID=UPI003CF79F6F